MPALRFDPSNLALPASPMFVRFLHCALLALALLPLAPVRAGGLTVSAASSLSDAFKEIATAFETRHPGTTVRLNFASSGTLLQQIARGAPVDVFASADLATLDAAAGQGLIVSAQRRNFAGNDLVLIVPGGPGVQPAQIARLADLASPAVRRIAIGNPASVPVGRYARAALESAGLWRKVEPRLINARNARQVLDYVARGEVDAGFVYATDAAVMKEKLRVVSTVALPMPVLYPVAPVAASAEPAAARAFVAFVVSAPAQEILLRYGFSSP